MPHNIALLRRHDKRGHYERGADNRMVKAEAKSCRQGDPQPSWVHASFGVLYPTRNSRPAAPREPRCRLYQTVKPRDRSSRNRLFPRAFELITRHRCRRKRNRHVEQDAR
jgi:hypothetical protein